MNKLESNIVNSFNLVKRDISNVRESIVEIAQKHEELVRLIEDLKKSRK